eukprot:gene23178-biopygen14850
MWCGNRLPGIFPRTSSTATPPCVPTCPNHLLRDTPGEQAQMHRAPCRLLLVVPGWGHTDWTDVLAFPPAWGSQVGQHGFSKSFGLPAQLVLGKSGCPPPVVLLLARRAAAQCNMACTDCCHCDRRAHVVHRVQRLCGLSVASGGHDCADCRSVAGRIGRAPRGRSLIDARSMRYTASWAGLVASQWVSRGAPQSSARGQDPPGGFCGTQTPRLAPRAHPFRPPLSRARSGRADGAGWERGWYAAGLTPKEFYCFGDGEYALLKSTTFCRPEFTEPPPLGESRYVLLCPHLDWFC